MYVWTGPWTRVQEPTPLLRRLAGEFADRIALAWPAPHGPFLIAEAARRHLACLAVIRDGDALPDLEPVLRGSLKQAIRRVLPGAPEGLERALGRLGEEAWPATAYGLLLTALTDPARAKALRHAETLSVADVEGLAGLPVALVRASHGALRLTPAQSDLVAEAYRVIAERDGAKAANAAANRWGRAKQSQGLFERIRQDVVAEPPPPPFAGTATLRPLATRADIRAAGRRFHNCLAEHRLSWAASGEYAYLEWTVGAGAVVELTRDSVFGWRLNEARGPRNAPIPADQRPVLAAELRSLGIQVTRGCWSFLGELDRAADPGFQRDDQTGLLGELFGE